MANRDSSFPIFAQEGQVLWEVVILPDSDHEMQLPMGVARAEGRCELTLFAFYLFTGGGGGS